MTIDWWTLGIQTVNVVILVWLLQRFFWRPVAAMIEQRRATAQTALWPRRRRHAQQGDRRAGRDRADARRLCEGARSDPGRGPRRGGSGRAPRVWTRPRRRRRLWKRPRRRRSRRSKQAAEKAWTERSSRLAVEIAERLAARLDGAGGACRLPRLAAQGDPALCRTPARQAVAANGAALEAISATPLDPAEQERYRELIGEAFGSPSADRLQDRSCADRRPGTARPAPRREQQLARRSRANPRGPHA